MIGDRVGIPPMREEGRQDARPGGREGRFKASICFHRHPCIGVGGAAGRGYNRRRSYTPATEADQAALRAYLVDLHAQVLSLVRSGQSWDQLYRNVRFSDEVKKWIAFDTMHTLNVLGMYRWVTNHRRGEW